MPSILRRRGRGSNKHTVFFTLCILMLSLGITNGAWAVLNDVAIYRPGIQGGMSVADQTTTAAYIHDNIAPVSKVIYAGHDQTLINSLTGWMNSHMNDGQSDLLIIIDIIPAALFQGEPDNSHAELWMDNGNMLLWTGSEPFANYVDTGGTVSDAGAGAAGASKALNVSSSGLCRGGGLQKGTSAVFYQYHDELGALQTDPDGDYDISAFVEYTAQNALNYSQLLIDANDSDWDHMSNWKVDEVFAEDSESYQSDNIVLVNTENGQFAQFYTTTDLNDERKQVITQVINNWVALPCNTLTVDDDFVNPGPNEYTTIQAAVDAAQPRDTILVKPGQYNEQLDLKTNTFLGTRGIKIVSDTADGGNEFLDPGNPVDVALMNSNVDVCSPGEDPAVIAQWQLEWSDGRPGYSESYAAAYGVDVESKKVLRRAARTIIYGTNKPDGTEGKPMVDFALGSTAGTILDGFTVCDMPQVNHVIPGHSHVVQTRGGSATVVNNIVYNNGSSGLGSHAWFYDQNNAIETRDFRYANIMHDAHPVLINNVVFRNEGNNLGNNHYSYALMYNNELFESISIDDHESPGIGCQHGAHPLIDDNLVYKSDWVGIGGRKGEEQGLYPINRPTHPIVRNNKVFDAGENDTSAGKPAGYPFPGAHGAGIGGDDTGGWDPKTNEFKYHIIEYNYVNGAQNAAIGVRSIDPAYGELPPDAGAYPPDLGYVRIINNEATGGGTGDMGAGIGLNGAHAVEISDNITHDNNDAGIGIRGGGSANLIANNESYDNDMAGIGLKEGAAVGTITGNNLYDNALAGIGHDGLSGRVSVTLESSNTIANNGTDGIGIQAADIGEISYNTIENNAAPGITIVGGSSAGLVVNNVLDHNGITAGATGFSILEGGQAVIRDTTISYSGRTSISIFGPNTNVTIENSTLMNSAQNGLGPNLVASDGAIVTVSNSELRTTTGSPNIQTSGTGTVLNMSGCLVTDSAKPGLVSSAGATLIIDDTIFDSNGTDSTAGMSIENSHIEFDGITIANSMTWGAIIDGCTGSIHNSDIYASGSSPTASPGQLDIQNSVLDIIGNIFHYPRGYNSHIELYNGSNCNVYHNTFTGNVDGGAGPFNHGPGAGLYVDATSSADVRNNIISRMPKGIIIDAGAVVTASTNNYHMIMDGNIVGDNIILSNPYLDDTFHLDPYSPLIDAGELIPGVNDNYGGNAPDVGALESPAPPLPLAWQSPTFIWSDGGDVMLRLVDGDLTTGKPWGGGGWIKFQVSDTTTPIYGIRFFNGDYVVQWHVLVSDDSGQLTYLTKTHGWNQGTSGPGVWDEWSVDYFRSGKYLHLDKVGGPLPPNFAFEFEVLMRDTTQ